MSANTVLDIARGELNVTEFPPNSNRVKYWDSYNPTWQGQPWCVAFLWWCFQQAGEGQVFFGGGKTASCGTLLRWYSAQGQTVAKQDVQPGDIVILNFSGTNDTQHCGLVVEVPYWGVIKTIEGNTSIAGSQSNGGQVCLKTRNLSQIVGVCRPQYKKEESMPKADYENHWAKKDIRWCIDRGLLTGYPDGTFQPDKPVTRAEMAVIIRRICNYCLQLTTKVDN